MAKRVFLAFLGGLAIQAAILAVPAVARAQTSSYFCLHWVTGPQKVCRDPVERDLWWVNGVSYPYSYSGPNSVPVCVDMQYYSGGSYHNYFSWVCDPSGDTGLMCAGLPGCSTGQPGEIGSPVEGYAVVKNNATSGSGVALDGEDWYS